MSLERRRGPPDRGHRRRASPYMRRSSRSDMIRSWTTRIERVLTLLRADRAAPPRTLVDILRSTTDDHPDAAAIDNGAEVLTYTELVEQADELAVAAGRGGRRPGRAGSASASAPAPPTCTSPSPRVLLAGAAYVPVDADDPDERARTVFDEADVAAVIRDGLAIETVSRRRTSGARRSRTPTDDAWIIFTSGSTGTPKGVAVTHRSAAAFVDAESRLFLQDAPLGPGDRVMAGLSVAFDASCEEMWLAWAYGACLVPAPRSLVRSGMDLGPWLVANDVTVVSTVPTLVVAVADGGAGRGPAADPRRRGLPAGDRGPAGHRRPRGLEHLRPDRGHGGRPAAPGSPARGRCGSGCRSTAGTSPSSTATGTHGRGRGQRRADHRRGRAGALPRPGEGRREVRADAHARAGSVPTAAATWSGTTRRGCSSSAAPTTRSSSAAGGSSSARSTPRCSRSPA